MIPAPTHAALTVEHTQVENKSESLLSHVQQVKTILELSICWIFMGCKKNVHNGKNCLMFLFNKKL